MQRSRCTSNNKWKREYQFGIRAFLPRFIFRLHALSECIRMVRIQHAYPQHHFGVPLVSAAFTLSYTSATHLGNIKQHFYLSFAKHYPNTKRRNKKQKKTICHDFLRIFYLFRACMRMCANTFGCVCVWRCVCVRLCLYE